MINSDFSRGVTIKPYQPEKGTVERQNKLPHLRVEFTRKVSKCPGCGSASFTQKRSSARWIYAIVSGKPSDCRIIRKEYECKNADCSLNHCFYNTHGYEDGYFIGKGSTSNFVNYILQKWLADKTLSFLDINREYGISGNEADTWALSLREEFDSHFEITTQPIMVFRSFIDKNGIERGFMGSPSGPNLFRMQAFIDNYTPLGLASFYTRIKKGSQVSKIYYDGPEFIGAELNTLFNAPVLSTSNVDLGKVDTILREIVERVNKKDSYSAISLKYLYDNSPCRDAILTALRKTATKHGARPYDINTFGWVTSFSFDGSDRLSDYEVLEQFKELPRIADYYAEY